MTAPVERLALVPILEAPEALQMAILDIRNEPGVRANMYHSSEISAAEHRVWLAHLKKTPSTRYFLVLEGDELLGGLSFSNISRRHRRADWAFFLKAAARGRGLGRALEMRALDHAFAALDLHKLNCEVISWNEAVIALHDSFGFVEEGRRRAHVRRDGAYFDVHLLGITAGE